MKIVMAADNRARIKAGLDPAPLTHDPIDPPTITGNVDLGSLSEANRDFIADHHGKWGLYATASGDFGLANVLKHEACKHLEEQGDHVQAIRAALSVAEVTPAAVNTLLDAVRAADGELQRLRSSALERHQKSIDELLNLDPGQLVESLCHGPYVDFRFDPTEALDAKSVVDAAPDVIDHALSRSRSFDFHFDIANDVCTKLLATSHYEDIEHRLMTELTDALRSFEATPCDLSHISNYAWGYAHPTPMLGSYTTQPALGVPELASDPKHSDQVTEHVTSIIKDLAQKVKDSDAHRDTESRAKTVAARLIARIDELHAERLELEEQRYAAVRAALDTDDDLERYDAGAMPDNEIEGIMRKLLFAPLASNYKTYKRIEEKEFRKRSKPKFDSEPMETYSAKVHAVMKGAVAAMKGAGKDATATPILHYGWTGMREEPDHVVERPGVRLTASFFGLELSRMLAVPD